MITKELDQVSAIAILFFPQLAALFMLKISPNQSSRVLGVQYEVYI